MKCLITMLLMAFIATTGYAQVDKIATKLPDYLISGVGVIHTVKIEVVNHSQENKLVILRNDEELTHIEFSRDEWTNPLQFIEEYGGTLYLNPKNWVPSPFGVWFKVIAPNSKFTFYFQSRQMLDRKRLIDLVKVCKNNFSNRKKTLDDLGWKPDEIIITLPVKD